MTRHRTERPLRVDLGTDARRGAASRPSCRWCSLREAVCVYRTPEDGSVIVDFLDQKRSEIDARLGELRPLVDEFHRLERAAAALGGTNGAAPARVVRRGPGRPPGRKTTTRAATAPVPPSAPGRRRRGGGRPSGGGRSAQALGIITQRPGITIAELAAEMGVHANYLYRVVPALAKDGKVSKQGRGWHAAVES